MAERDFRSALLHLYRIADRDDPSLRSELTRFALSGSEQAWLDELMASQRDRLRFVNAHLRTKRWKFVRRALPTSLDAFPEPFEALLRDWSRDASLEGEIDGADAVRAFAGYVEAQLHPAAPRAHAFIRFDALCAAVSLCPRRRDRPEAPTPELHLALGEDADLVRCEYDVAALQVPALFERAERLPMPQIVLLFRQHGGDVRTLVISPGLATALQRFGEDTRLGQVLEAAEPGPTRDALAHSLAQMLQLGVPFFVPAGPEGPVATRVRT
jgi:hypothetical protein